MFDPSTRILVVDDMMVMRKIVIKACKEMGFTDFSEASDGALAWAAMQNSNPPFGLVISDWTMPNCTGLDLLKRVRGDSRLGKTPFVMLTAEAEQKQVIEAVKAGVTNYAIKPFTPEILKTKLEEAHKKVAA